MRLRLSFWFFSSAGLVWLRALKSARRMHAAFKDPRFRHPPACVMSDRDNWIPNKSKGARDRFPALPMANAGREVSYR